MKRTASRKGVRRGKSAGETTADRIRSDVAALNRLGLASRTVAARMARLRSLALAGLGNTVKLGRHLEGEADSSRGKIACPFGHPGLFPKTNITVRNLRLGREIWFSELHIHMISGHDYFEEKGSPYRLEPQALAEILELKGGRG